jgi:hypothetical protein
MGVYYYTYRKSIKPKKAQFNGQEIQVGVAEFAASHGYIYGWEGMHASGKRAVTRAQNIPADEQADYIVFGGIDGYTVYKNNKLGAWCDTPHWSGIKDEDEIGKIFKIKGRYHIVPKGITVRDFMKIKFPELYFKPLRSTQVYVGIHAGYTATVREIRQLEDYVFGFGSNDVDRTKFTKKQVGQDVPEWFDACVDEVINEKIKELETVNETV